MKRKKLLLALAVAATAFIAVLLSLLLFQFGGAGIPPLDAPPEAAGKPVRGKLVIEIPKEKMPKAPEKVNVYRFEPIADSEREIEEFAARFGIPEITREVGKSDGGVFYIGSVGDRIETSLSFFYGVSDGHLNYQDHAKLRKENPNLPSDDEIEGIALRTLERLGLLPDEAYVSGTGGLEEATFRDGQPVKYWRYRNVVVSRKVDGFYIIGPGMEVKVSLGTDGELVKLDSMMRELVPFREYPAKSLEEAIVDAQKGRETMNLYPEVVNPVVKKAEILYYADPAKPENKYLQPVYALTGPETCIYVPAIKQ